MEKGTLGIKSILSVTIFGEKLVSKSNEWHKDIISARKDAAQQLLDILNIKK